MPGRVDPGGARRSRCHAASRRPACERHAAVRRRPDAGHATGRSRLAQGSLSGREQARRRPDNNFSIGLATGAPVHRALFAASQRLASRGRTLARQPVEFSFFSTNPAAITPQIPSRRSFSSPVRGVPLAGHRRGLPGRHPRNHAPARDDVSRSLHQCDPHHDPPGRRFTSRRGPDRPRPRPTRASFHAPVRKTITPTARSTSRDPQERRGDYLASPAVVPPSPHRSAPIDEPPPALTRPSRCSAPSRHRFAPFRKLLRDPHAAPRWAVHARTLVPFIAGRCRRAETKPPSTWSRIAFYRHPAHVLLSARHPCPMATPQIALFTNVPKRLSSAVDLDNIYKNPDVAAPAGPDISWSAPALQASRGPIPTCRNGTRWSMLRTAGRRGPIGIVVKLITTMNAYRRGRGPHAASPRTR